MLHVDPSLCDLYKMQYFLETDLCVQKKLKEVTFKLIGHNCKKVDSEEEILLANLNTNITKDY